MIKVYAKEPKLKVSGITNEAEALSISFENSEQKTAKAAKNLANEVVNNPSRTLELPPDLSTAVATGKPIAMAATTPSVTKVFLQGKVFSLGRIQ